MQIPPFLSCRDLISQDGDGQWRPSAPSATEGLPSWLWKPASTMEHCDILRHWCWKLLSHLFSLPAPLRTMVCSNEARIGGWWALLASFTKEQSCCFIGSTHDWSSWLGYSMDLLYNLSSPSNLCGLPFPAWYLLVSNLLISFQMDLPKNTLECISGKFPFQRWNFLVS